MIEYVSIREFARRIGVNEKTVRMAISSGKIITVDRSNPKFTKLNPEIALKEWSLNFDPTNDSGIDISKKVISKKTEKVTKKNVDINISNSTKENIQNKQIKELTPVHEGRSIADIKRQTAEVVLRLKAVELKEKQGQLVDKDLVYAALFDAGQEMKVSFQSIPDRVIDAVLSAKDRGEAYNILYKEIVDSLERFYEIYKRPLTKKNGI